MTVLPRLRFRRLACAKPHAIGPGCSGRPDPRRSMPGRCHRSPGARDRGPGPEPGAGIVPGRRAGLAQATPRRDHGRPRASILRLWDRRRVHGSTGLWRAVARPSERAREASPRRSRPHRPWSRIPTARWRIPRLQLLRSSFPPPRRLVEVQEGSYDQGDQQVRGSLVAAGVVAIGGALLTAAAGPVGAADGQAVSAAPTGTVSTDGTVTVFGAYRCSPSSGPGPVFVSSSVRVGEVRHGIGGTLLQRATASNTHG